LNRVQSGDLYQTDFIEDTEKKITDKAVKNNPILKLYKQRFIVIAMYGASVGNIAISNIDAYVNQACCCVIPSSEYDLDYLFYFFTNLKKKIC
jgi:type I restriction enzyme S subunit